MKQRNILFTNNQNTGINDRQFEVVERKGMGHPDTICDGLAEEISIEYSRYCLENFGCILRHMIDKISVTGGLTQVTFGGGKMISPAKIHLKGRFTDSVGDIKIPYKEISRSVILKQFEKIYSNFSEDQIIIEDNTHFSPGPGIIFDKSGDSRNVRKGFFINQTEETIKYHNNELRSNDTSTTVCYYPVSALEKIVRDLENYLNSEEIKQNYPYIGTDIKIMGKRDGSNISLTLCVPLISKYVDSIDEYNKKIKIVHDLANDFLVDARSVYCIDLSINTRDREDKDDLYLTLLGSALESGDEGSVGRGNRIHGVIPFTRNFTTEAACGKNPVYHIGKIYSAFAYAIAKYVYENFNIENTVYLTSQIGRSINNPWAISIDTCVEIDNIMRKNISEYVDILFISPQKITESILEKEIPFY